MEAIITPFNKHEINLCSDRCITTLHHKSFTPDQLSCLQRCTKNVMRGVNAWQRLRSDSEELQLKENGL